MTSQSQRPPMDPVVVDTLLEALSNDDDFRALFVRDHFSRRLGAFQGVCIDAETPGDVPEPVEIR